MKNSKDKATIDLLKEHRSQDLVDDLFRRVCSLERQLEALENRIATLERNIVDLDREVYGHPI